MCHNVSLMCLSVGHSQTMYLANDCSHDMQIMWTVAQCVGNLCLRLWGPRTYFIEVIYMIVGVGKRFLNLRFTEVLPIMCITVIDFPKLITVTYLTPFYCHSCLYYSSNHLFFLIYFWNVCVSIRFCYCVISLIFCHLFCQSWITKLSLSTALFITV